MQKTETGYNIETYDDGVLHFVIGCEYSAVATNGGKEHIGKLVIVPYFGGIALYNEKKKYINIDEKSLRYL